MIYNAGDFPTSATVIIPINTFDSNDPTASVTATNLANTDVHIHKDGGTTQRNNAAGITMTIDFDSITGNHILIIDTSNNTVAGFYQAGHEYQVRVEGVTVDGATINAWVGCFSIERSGGALANSKELLTRIPDASPGANGGLPTTNGTKLNQTVDLTAGQSIACSDKTGFSLSATGADLILKSSTFVQAIVAAVNEFATYGLTALNTLLVTTGIKAASIPITAADIKAALEADGSKLDHLWEMTEDDGGVRRLTTNALELAPSGSGLDAEGVRTAIGLATANLDTQLGAIPTTAMRGTDNAATATNLAAAKAVIDAIKLKTDTLGGAGAIPWTYTVTDSTTGLPISDVDVWVTTDSAGTNVIATGKTNTLGVINFSLDAGTYYFWSQKSGVDFVNPDCESVTA